MLGGNEITPPPFKHQADLIEATKDRTSWALFWEMRLGKSRVIVDTAAHNFLNGNIGALIIVTENGLHEAWATDELPKWSTIPYKAAVYHARKASTKKHAAQIEEALSFDGLAVLCITYDAAAITDLGKATLWRFLKRRALLVIDESSAVKTPDARRTRTLIKASQYAVMRRILNGTPIDRSPLDVYSQIQILEPDFWQTTMNIKSYTAFRAEFAQMKKGKRRIVTPDGEPAYRHFNQVVGYKNLPKLSEALGKISSRLTQADVFDLPPKIYERRLVEMTDEQQRIYDQLKEETFAYLGNQRECEMCGGVGTLDYDGVVCECLNCLGARYVYDKQMTTRNAGTLLTRLQQVLSGYVTADDEPVADIPGRNPRIEALEAIIDQTEGPWLVWGRFQRDVEKALAALRKKGLRCGDYYGPTRPDDRTKNRQAFQNGELDALILSSAGSKGIRLTAARSSVIISRSYKLIDRLQSEERPVHVDMKDSHLYVDIVCPGTVDEHVLKNLQSKTELAASVLGDKLKEWLQ